MEQGAELPDLSLLGGDGPVRLRDLLGPHGLVLYFYPKDDTSGCTREAQDFSALRDRFADAGVAVVGISRDPIASHDKFTAKHGLTVRLLSDEGPVSDAFGTWVEKSMYGRRYMGMERATFLFGADGRLRQDWRKVRVPGHADAVLAAATAP